MNCLASHLLAPRWLRVVFGITLFAALFLLFDPSTSVAVLRGLDPAWLVFASALIAGITLLGAINLYLFLSASHHAPRFTEFLPIYWTAWAVGLVVPGQVGDMASVTTLLHRRGHAWQAVLARSLLDKLISFLAMIAVAMFSLVPIFHARSWRMEWLALLAGVTILAVGAGWLLRRRLMKRLPRWSEAIAGIFSELMLALKKSPGYVLVNVMLTLLKIFMMGLAYWSIFRAMGVTGVDILPVVPLVAASALVAYIPISFNGLGTVEAAGLALFASVGIAAPAVLAAYLALRLIVLVLAWLPAGVWILAGRKEAAR